MADEACAKVVLTGLPAADMLENSQRRDSEVLPWSCVSVSTPHGCLPGSREASHQSEASLRRPGRMNHLLLSGWRRSCLSFWIYMGILHPQHAGFLRGARGAKPQRYFSWAASSENVKKLLHSFKTHTHSRAWTVWWDESQQVDLACRWAEWVLSILLMWHKRSAPWLCSPPGATPPSLCLSGGGGKGVLTLLRCDGCCKTSSSQIRLAYRAQRRGQLAARLSCCSNGAAAADLICIWIFCSDSFSEIIKNCVKAKKSCIISNVLQK